MKHKKLVLLTLCSTIGLTLGLTMNVMAKDVTKEEIKEKIEKKIGVGQVSSINPSGYGDLLEVLTSREILYADKAGKYIFAGNIVDLETGKSLTQERFNEVNKIDFKSLPLDKALKTVKGNGKRVIAVFEDPNCGYCKQFRKNLQDVDNITVYTFQYNILSPDSMVKSKNVWCSPEKEKTWDEWMLHGTVPPTVKECDTPHEQVLALGKKLRVNGTPTIYFTDGSRAPGSLSAKDLEAKFTKVK